MRREKSSNAGVVAAAADVCWAALVGTVAAFPVWMGFWFVSEGAPWRWQRDDWYGIALFSVVFGIAGGRLMRKNV